MTSRTAHSTSTGHVLSAPGWLDVHFAACAEAYEALLDAAGFEPGMSVLDAGCGTGSYLPLLGQRVGPQGQVHALDFASENIEAAGGGALGSVTHLPYAGRAFDGVWCANVLQYFDDAETVRTIEEMRRVVRPGGIVAVKDVDMTGLRLSPAPPFLGTHLAEACIRGDDATTQSFGCLRARDLRRFLEAAGLHDVRQTSLLIEHFYPLGDAARQLWSDWLPYLANLALDKGVPEEDAAVWRQLVTPDLALQFINRPGFYACELQVTAAGIV